jgi:hypothetical protein
VRSRSATLRGFILAIMGIAAGLPMSAWACSCLAEPGTHQQQVQAALSAADAVLVVKIRQVKQTLDNSYPDWPVTHETVQFVVLEVLKGRDRVFVGQPLVTFSKVANGLCALSARNDPPWITDLDDTPVAFSDTWLIYVSEPEPFDLSSCTRSLPLTIVNAQQDLALLRQLMDRVPAQRPRWEKAAFADPPGLLAPSLEDRPR